MERRKRRDPRVHAIEGHHICVRLHMSGDECYAWTTQTTYAQLTLLIVFFNVLRGHRAVGVVAHIPT